MDEEWIRILVLKNDMHDFYSSSEWSKLAARAREMQHNECQRCKAKGYYRACEIVHHKLYVKLRPDLALDLDNLECLCRECHEEEHAERQVFINEERW